MKRIGEYYYGSARENGLRAKGAFTLIELLAVGFGMMLSAAHAHWYTAVMDPGSDIVSIDVRWPYWPPGTYFALWNMTPYPDGGPFYGGVAVEGGPYFRDRIRNIVTQNPIISRLLRIYIVSCPCNPVIVRQHDASDASV